MGALATPLARAPFYGRQGWQAFAGELWISQSGGRQRFTALGPMTRAVGQAAPETGTIDLCGLPW